MNKLTNDQLSEVCKTLLTHKIDTDQYRVLQSSMRAVFESMQNEAWRSLKVGDKVKFFSRKQGITVRGHISRFLTKNVEVQPEKGGRPWRCTPSLLEKA